MRQVHVTLYIYIYTHSHIDRQASPSTTHGPFLAVTAKWLQIPRTRPSIHLRAQVGKLMLLYIYIYIYIYRHTHTGWPASPSTTHGPFLAVTAKLLQLQSTRIRSIWAPKAASPYYYIYIYIYICTHTHTHTHTHAYLYTQTLTDSQASPSISARHLVCSFDEMIGTTTHENFNPLARPRRQVNVTLYIYEHTHIYIHNHTHRPAKYIYHSRLLFYSYCEMIATTTNVIFDPIARRRPQVHVIYIYIYIHTYIYTHT
jgi:hypothetical protein